MRRLLALALAMLVLAAPAQAGSFLDPEARVFTLAWNGGGYLRPLPDGSVLINRGVQYGMEARPELWRLWLDGRLEPLTWAGANVAVAEESGGTVLVIRAGGTAVERLDLATRTRATVADLAGQSGMGRDGFRFYAQLAALDDGSIVASNRFAIWRISPAGVITRVRGQRDGVRALAALPGGGFAANEDKGPVLIVPGIGLSRRSFIGGFGGFAPSGEGRVLTTTTRLADGSPRPALTFVDAAGRPARLEWTAGGGFADGDGGPLREVPWETPRWLAVAADGSLLFATDDGRLRAVVPSDSPRPRIALAPSTRAMLEYGRVAYDASTAGTLALEVRQGSRIVARAAGATAGGHGELALDAPPPGIYELRLRLDTGRAAVEAREAVDVRTSLTLAQGRAALRDPVYARDGDFGPCRRLTRRTVECLVLRVHYGDEVRELTVPWAWARATLERDRRTAVTIRPIDPRPRVPRVRVTIPSVQPLAARGVFRARVRSSAPARGHAVVTISGGAGRDVSGLVRQRRIRPGEPWEAEIRLGPRRTARLRNWLRSPEDFSAYVQVTVVAAAGPGEVTFRRLKTIAP